MSPCVPVVHVAAVCAISGRVGQLSRRIVQCITRIPTPGNAFLPVQVDVVSVDVPLLLGLDLLGDGRIYFNNVKNLLFPRH